MVVAIIAGLPGRGKTSSLIYFTKIYQPYRWGLLELKDLRSLDAKGVTYDNLTAITDEYKNNPNEILKSCEKWRDKVIKDKTLKLIVIDGISDLRRFARDEWDANPNNRKATGKNIHAWEMINNRVRGIINPIINYGLFMGVHVFLTTQMKDIYENDIKRGKEPDIKEWLQYDCECLIQLHKTGDKYTCSCDKAPMWSQGTFSCELRKDTGLLEVLSMQGLLEEG